MHRRLPESALALAAAVALVAAGAAFAAGARRPAR